MPAFNNAFTPQPSYNGVVNNGANIAAANNYQQQFQQPQPQPTPYYYNNYPNNNNNYANNNLIANTPYNNYMGINNNGSNNFQNQQSTAYFKCRPVSSEEEARACQIDLDGSLWIFTNLGNNKIYTKRVDENGLSDFNTYVLAPKKQSEQLNIEQATPANQAPAAQYVTKNEFNTTVMTLANAIKSIRDTSSAPVQSQNTVQNNEKPKANDAVLLDFN